MFNLFRRTAARTAPKTRLGLEALDARDLPAATLASAVALPVNPSAGAIIVIGSTPADALSQKVSPADVLAQKVAPSVRI